MGAGGGKVSAHPVEDRVRVDGGGSAELARGSTAAIPAFIAWRQARSMRALAARGGWSPATACW